MDHDTAGITPDPVALIGVDFTSAPSRAKPIVVAHARLTIEPRTILGQAQPGASIEATTLRMHRFETFASLDDFNTWLQAPAHWIGGFDLPFGLPRAFVAEQGWGSDDWPTITRRVAAMTRSDLVDRCRAYAAVRPVGSKFAHRATDRPAGSSPSMKWVNPPVVLMLHAGAPRLLAAGVALPAHGGSTANAPRIAFEAYPGLVAHRAIGRKSYKSDDVRRHDAGRVAVRASLLAHVEQGGFDGIRIAWARGLREPCLQDGRGDHLDAVLCALQAAWAVRRRDQGWGLPPDIDPVEGWIIAA